MLASSTKTVFNAVDFYTIVLPHGAFASLLPPSTARLSHGLRWPGHRACTQKTYCVSGQSPGMLWQRLPRAVRAETLLMRFAAPSKRYHRGCGPPRSRGQLITGVAVSRYSTCDPVCF